MIEMYCRDHHDGASRDEDGLCGDCAELLAYARVAAGQVPVRDGQADLRGLPDALLRPVMRERVRDVMRYSGPRMLKRHPVLAVAHLVDGRRKLPDEA